MAIAKKQAGSMLPWSYSRLKNYERCPRYAYEVHVLKNAGPPSPAMERGTALHAHAEAIVNGTLAKPPREFIAHGKNFRALERSVMVKAESKFAVTATWEKTEFFAPDVWGRGIFDVIEWSLSGIRVIDHKTGRKYPDHIDQLRLYAAVALTLEPSAPKATAEAWYLDLPPSENLSFEMTRAEVPLVRKDYERRVAKMANDKLLLPKPNYLCKFCHINRKNGGDCDADS